MKKYYLLVGALFIAMSMFANVRLPKIFGDNMILQREKPIPIWGWAEPNEKVTVQLDKQKKSIRTDKTGRWKVSMDPMSAGGPYQLLVKGKNSITINNILVGDVWICSGQSNMEWAVRNSNNAEAEIQNANFPEIRHFKVPHAVSATPKDDVTGGDWKLTTPSTAGDFTAVGYFFAKELYNELKVPIGLINTSWGGTHSETWTSRKAFEENEEFRDMISAMQSVDLETMAKQKKEASRKKIEALQGSFGNASDIGQWKDASYDDSRWPKMMLPSIWEAKGLEDVDGVVWFRKTFMLSDADAGKEAIVELGTIDDADDTYINGTKVGSTRSYNEPRRYTIPAGILKAGKNVIAVRVVDNGGGGGINGKPELLKINIPDKSTSLSGEWNFSVESLLEGNTTINPNAYPTLLFNAMINPIVPYAIKGVIWYQGESNAGRAYQYRKAFPLMISDWRNYWKQGDFPFYFVQLANYNAGNGNSEKGSTWAELREAQTAALALPNTGMAVITDIGEAADIHPRNKQDVGKRLAAIALNKLYQKQVVFSGPIYESMKIDGNKVIINFANVGSGLMIKDKYGYVKGFEIAAADKKFNYAKAFVDGDRVVVYQDNVTNPVAVRYAWADNPEDANLFNKEGFPANSFRTDTWKGVTEEAKFSISR